MKEAYKLLPALFEFTVYYERTMPQIIRLSSVFINTSTKNLSNAAMQFLISNATDKVVDHLLLRTFEALNLTNTALKHYQEPILNKSEPCFTDLIRLRNKIVSHKVENEIDNIGHKEWKNINYNSSKKVTDLVLECADMICEKIYLILDEHECANHIFQPRIYKEFNNDDFDKILNSLKDANIY